jgi:hypothetical protein
MATTYTDNYNLGMQEDSSDKFSMKVITDNMKIIDQALSEKADAVETLNLSAPASALETDDDLNTYFNVGQWTSVGATLSSLSNVPDNQNDFELIVMHTIADFTGIQICIYTTGDIYIRTLVTLQGTTTFGSWNKLTTSAA